MSVATAILRSLEDASTKGPPIGIEDFDRNMCAARMVLVDGQETHADPFCFATELTDASYPLCTPSTITKKLKSTNKSINPNNKILFRHAVIACIAHHKVYDEFKGKNKRFDDAAKTMNMIMLKCRFLYDGKRPEMHGLAMDQILQIELKKPPFTRAMTGDGAEGSGAAAAGDGAAAGSTSAREPGSADVAHESNMVALRAALALGMHLKDPATEAEKAKSALRKRQLDAMSASLVGVEDVDDDAAEGALGEDDLGMDVNITPKKPNRSEPADTPRMVQAKADLETAKASSHAEQNASVALDLQREQAAQQSLLMDKLLKKLEDDPKKVYEDKKAKLDSLLSTNAINQEKWNELHSVILATWINA